jgi:hypothetical protein
MSLKAYMVIICFFVGFFIGTGAKLLYEINTFKPYGWNESRLPIIANCYGDDFSKLNLIKALDFWAVRGYNAESYNHEPEESICNNMWPDGYIVLRKHPGPIDELTLASTTRRTSGFRIRSAEIHYYPGTQNLDLINEHELGHAFGFGHVEFNNHIMHPLYENIGPEFWLP